MRILLALLVVSCVSVVGAACGGSAAPVASTADPTVPATSLSSPTPTEAPWNPIYGYDPGTSTGVAEVDRVMTAIASLDLEALAALTYIDEHPCLDDRHAPTAYWCLPGTEPGTPIRLVHAEFCAGSGVFPGSEVFAIYRPLLDSRPRLWGLQELPADYPSSKRPGVPKSRYMLFVVSGGDPPSGFTIRLTADGLIQGIGYGCGDRPEKIWDAWLGTAQPLLAPPAAPRPR